eukprot:g6478.t1
MLSHLADFAQQQEPAGGRFRRPRVKMVEGRAFVYDAVSAAALLSEHRIWATPVGVRRARNKSPEQNFPCVLSQEQTALVLSRKLADVTYDPPSSSLSFSEESGVCRGVEDQESAEGARSSRREFPGTPAEKKSMAVFEDLLGKGLCPVSGSNYGADYVVYNGPPTERHSVAAVIVGRGTNDELSPAEVSGFARVQKAVGKRSIIATAPRGTGDSPSPLTGTGATVATATAAPRNVEAVPTDVVGRIAAAPRYQGGPPTPAAAAAAPTHDGVRYVTLQFHSVSYRT